MKDTIYRADAIKAVRKEYEDAINIGDNGDAIADDVDRILSALPSADAYTEQQVRDAFNSGYECGMEQTKEALSAEAVQGCDGCIYDTKIPQGECFRCNRYWRDGYKPRKGGDDK